jgi:hypothetical protein
VRKKIPAFTAEANGMPAIILLIVQQIKILDQCPFARRQPNTPGVVTTLLIVHDLATVCSFAAFGAADWERFADNGSAQGATKVCDIHRNIFCCIHFYLTNFYKNNFCLL